MINHLIRLLLPPLPELGLVGNLTSRVRSLTPAELESATTLTFTPTALDSIRRTVGSRQAETGAVLGGSRRTGVISRVWSDRRAATSRSTYSPDVAAVNRLLNQQWTPRGIDFLGFVHSHPAGATRPSPGDARYAADILAAVPGLDRLLLPIVQTRPDTGRFTLHPYAAVRDGKAARILHGSYGILDAAQPSRPQPFLERVATAYDPAVMSTTRIIAIGTGGSVSYLEDLARCGTGEFVLVDPDIVEPKNIGTQHVWPSDLGRPKVDALADRLAVLNPSCRVWTIRARETAISDAGFHRLLREPLPGGPRRPPGLAFLCAFTDNFQAQARIARLGLHFGVPTLSAAVYREGRGVEVSFAAAGLTEACIRCAQSGRYAAHLHDGYVNDVTSDGTPLYATSRLNALKQVVTMALLHRLHPDADAAHPATERQRRSAHLIANRNLVLTRLDPDIATSLGVHSFDSLAGVGGGRMVADDTVWVTPTPDRPDTGAPTCPDCGGTGDLAEAIGTFADTRVMPLVHGEGKRQHRLRN